MTRRVVMALFLCASGLMATAQRPAFEVATIKQNRTGAENANVRAQPGGRVSVTNNTLYNLVRNAYRLQGFQIVGGPDWIHTDRWDIVAKADGDPPQPMLIDMLKTLLADRFKVVLHNETREMPIFALVLARGDGRPGPQLHASTVDCQALATEARARGGAFPRAPGGGPLCGTNVGPGRMLASAVTLADFVRNIAPIAGRSVVDKTGLSGLWDLQLTWTADIPQGAAENTRAANDGTSLFTAVQEQLGLKLEAQRGPVDMLVIDSAERPVED
jgi:uncharacterized protein (TIGR03435 family)